MIGDPKAYRPSVIIGFAMADRSGCLLCYEQAVQPEMGL
jgi:hypothetical protein